MKKILKALVDLISLVIIAAAIIILLNVAVVHRGEPPQIFGYSMFRVMSGSMEPEIPTDSVVITQKTSASDIEVGDIITFYSNDPTLYRNANTHRVVAIDTDGGEYVFHTKGDSNIIEDKYLVYGRDLIGKVIKVSTILGFIVRLFSNPLIFGAVVAIPLLIILIVNLVKAVKATKNIAEEELGIPAASINAENVYDSETGYLCRNSEDKNMDAFSDDVSEAQDGSESVPEDQIVNQKMTNN